MNTTLPTTTPVVRLNAFGAALVVTLAMLAGIAHLADSPSAPLLAAASATAQRG